MNKQRYEELKHLGAGEKSYPDTPDRAILETFSNEHPDRVYWITFDSDEFTSLCPVTGQPDFGSIRIEYVPADRCIESKSLKLYLFSFRQVGSFYEDVINRIYSDLHAVLEPRRLVVRGRFTARGGITSTVRVDSAE
ncbi:preQ(1) synthase [Kiritimatiella glycovorans]|uniref:NADPH-dependent 7-cyano-7-deazaguanine reductase n=1 Tax=Kiritimatiella glycovorans TaxID=1307763 RepID=A0A0G3EJQ2_9BACT|nr:preQ(1) synthase [Kiritimatiella glycovorans]AKJ64354.1 NADPH-dependent 7-cyano-7-deazaguanine reductase [Kiritimatiella glycovorans]